MSEFTISEMQDMQKKLQDKYKNIWEPICADTGKNKLLWMIGEIGEVIDIVKKHGGEVVGVGVVVDRTGGKIDFGVPLESVISLDVVSYEPDDCPLCREGKPLVKPGSRNLKI